MHYLDRYSFFYYHYGIKGEIEKQRDVLSMNSARANRNRERERGHIDNLVTI